MYYRDTIIEILNDLSDPGFQSRAFAGTDPEVVSSPNELICQLFDDFNFEGFVRDELQTNQVGNRIAKKLTRLVNRLPDDLETAIGPKGILENQQWREIMSTAAELVAVLKNERADT